MNTIGNSLYCNKQYYNYPQQTVNCKSYGYNSPLTKDIVTFTGSNITTEEKKKTSKGKVLGLITGIAAAIIATVFAVKHHKTKQIAKSIEEIDKKFLKLQENISETQKTFNDVFLRNNITEKEASEMLNRYKEIEKLGVTGTKEEYIQAVFNEAKQNFGFADSKFKLKLCNGEVSKNGKTLGAAKRLGRYIEIDPAAKTEEIQGIIHHEMRHMKQNYFAANLNSQEYKNCLKKDVNEQLSKSELDEVLADCMNDILESFNLKAFSKSNVPPEYRDYAQKCLDAHKTYVDAHKDFDAYYNNFLEIDARHAGSLIDTLFHRKALGGNK